MHAELDDDVRALGGTVEPSRVNGPPHLLVARPNTA
jgi:hypothetical protein